MRTPALVFLAFSLAALGFASNASAQATTDRTVATNTFDYVQGAVPGCIDEPIHVEGDLTSISRVTRPPTGRSSAPVTPTPT
jgi:hypothetical protein